MNDDPTREELGRAAVVLAKEVERLKAENERLREMLSVPEVRQALLNSLALRQEV